MDNKNSMLPEAGESNWLMWLQATQHPRQSFISPSFRQSHPAAYTQNFQQSPSGNLGLPSLLHVFPSLTSVFFSFISVLALFYSAISSLVSAHKETWKADMDLFVSILPHACTFFVESSFKILPYVEVMTPFISSR